MKYKIVFDSNFLWHDNEDRLAHLFNSTIVDLKKFITENKISGDISLFVPQMVFDERLSQMLANIGKVINDIDSSFKNLEVFSVKKPARGYKTKDYGSFLTKEAKKFLESNVISVLKTPKIDQKVLIKRAISTVKPFNRIDKGFKDTVIWLTILDDAKKSSDTTYILCTSDKTGFHDDVLKKEMKSHKNDLVVVTSTQQIKEFFDKELHLELELKQKHADIKNEILKKIGTVMVNVNESLLDEGKSSVNIFKFNSFRLPRYNVLADDSEQEIVGYDFKDMTIKNISQPSGSIYTVETEIEVDPTRKSDANIVGSRNIFRATTFNLFVAPRKVKVKINFNDMTKDVTVVDIDTQEFGLSRAHYWGIDPYGAI